MAEVLAAMAFYLYVSAGRIRVVAPNIAARPSPVRAVRVDVSGAALFVPT